MVKGLPVKIWQCKLYIHAAYIKRLCSDLAFTFTEIQLLSLCLLERKQNNSLYAITYGTLMYAPFLSCLLVFTPVSWHHMLLVHNLPGWLPHFHDSKKQTDGSGSGPESSPVSSTCCWQERQLQALFSPPPLTLTHEHGALPLPEMKQKWV